jgi:hypothetical protein
MKFKETVLLVDEATRQGCNMPANRPEFQCYPQCQLSCNWDATRGHYVRRRENAASYAKGSHTHLIHANVVIIHLELDSGLQLYM